MKKLIVLMWAIIGLATFSNAQERRPIDSQHPLWMIHVDVWNSADPQKIIDLIPESIKPYVCMNLSLSCQYDTDLNMYRMPRCAVRTYKSWASVCQHNGMWFTCQPASGGHTHIQDDDLETFEYFFKAYPNFLGWNYAEQFWGFDESGDKSSSTQDSRIALFAKLVPMHHKYGGVLTISFCGNIWSHALNPIGMMKRNNALMQACKAYPEAVLWLYKYTTSSCFYNNESVTMGPFIAGLANNYGVRYDNCGWNGALDAILGEGHGKKYPGAAGIGTVMEQTAMNGGAVWDGPELIWTEDFQNLSNSSVDGYTRRNWGTFKNFQGIWLDMFQKVIDGTMYIPTREEVIGKTKIVVVNDVTSGSDEQKYAAWGDLYDGLYKQTDPFNPNGGQWMNNYCYFKSTGRYGAIPIVPLLQDELAKSIPVQVKKSAYTSRWGTLAKKTADFNAQYPEVSKGDLFVERFQNQLVTYMPYTYLNKKTTASASIPLQYNTCDSLVLEYYRLSSGLIREYGDHINIYLNNYRSDTTALRTDVITIKGAKSEPTYTLTRRSIASATASAAYEDGNYTLTIKHIGPVDIVINCEGNNEREALANEIQPLPLPKQPEEFNGPVIIEAENMDYKSVQNVALTHSGWCAPEMEEFAGMGYVQMGTSTSGSLRHQFKAHKAGQYKLTLRYLSSSKAGDVTIRMNNVSQTLRLGRTTEKGWLKATCDITVKEGTNDLRINNTNGVPFTLDQIIYTPADSEAEKFKVTVRNASNGSVVANVTEAAEGETVTLSVTADAGFQLTELRMVNSVYFTMAKSIAITPGSDEITFKMPDDNVTIQPVFTDMTSVYKLDFSTSTSSLPIGWQCEQENGEVHEYPNNYSAGARVFGTFSGFQGKALYWRKVRAEYGRQAAYPLHLTYGSYKLTYTMAAWVGSPRFKASIINASTGAVVKATATAYTATPTVERNLSANVSSATTRTLKFDILADGDYVISFTNATGGSDLDEFLLLDCQVNSTEPSTDIETLAATPSANNPRGIYDLAGRRRSAIGQGLNIVVTEDGKVKKVLTR